MSADDQFHSDEGRLLGCQRCADLFELLDRLVQLCRGAGLEAGSIDEAERTLRESPLHEALVEVAGDICAGRSSASTYECMMRLAQVKLQEKQANDATKKEGARL